MTTEAGSVALLDAWLARRLTEPARDWLTGKVRAAASGADAGFFLGFGTAPRQVGRATLALSAEELEDAHATRHDFQPALWSVDQAARARLVLALPAATAGELVDVLDRLFADGDLGELVALYQALPLLPYSSAHRARAAEGIRSNMKSVFEAVALRNPYPAEELSEPAWNQLVLKCLFVGSPLLHVHGIDVRANAPLASTLSDFAHERWAAGRGVSAELWRCLGPFAEGALLGDLERVLATGSDRERAAVALSARGNPRAALLLASHDEAVSRAIGMYPSWQAILG